MKQSQEADAALVKRAKDISGIKDDATLKAVLEKTLGSSLEGRRMLNDRDLSMSDIERLRKILKVR